MYKDKLCFRENGKFRIMQVADIQEEYPVSPDTLRLLSLALEREKPDLAIFTGDQINGISPCFFTGKREEKFRRILDDITAPFEKAGVPFAVTFGNHDEQIGIKNSEQAEIYYKYPHCIIPSYHSEKDKGTFRLPLYDREKHIFDIYVFDTNGQTPSGEYPGIRQDQTDWFRAEREKAKEEDYTKALVFQHIPVMEYYNVLKRVKFGTKGACEAFRTHRNEFYVLPDEIREKGGFMGESPASQDRNSGEFEALAEKGNILALFAGHDHNNSFVADYRGIKLVYTQCCGFNVYGPHLKRGVRIIDIDKNDLSVFGTHTLTYEELTDEKLDKPFKEFILTHIPTSMEQVKRLVLAGGAAGLTASAALLYMLYKRK